MTKALRPSGKDLSAKDVSGAEDSARPGRRMSPAETAQYVAEFSAELSYLAREANLDLLAYLLDMARLEAIRTVQSGDKEG
ncbi:hypothetical protein VB618_09140 [Microvirga sp. CF3062]|uniref:hypothetical protein n=1 Tax=Microvirga sp. CF3062 TaxID=3110182 RepID=UPI002E75A5C0|nr:hypothetical protein [Microvirga sp. CF3062]MEE1656360.1 hypothetical protein [Microvirga sp. CF3062]